MLWLINFALSLLVQCLGWAEQGKAFFYIHIGTAFLLSDIIGRPAGETLSSVKTTGEKIIIFFLTTWTVSHLLDVDFYVAYQIMILGHSLFYTKDN